MGPFIARLSAAIALICFSHVGRAARQIIFRAHLEVATQELRFDETLDGGAKERYKSFIEKHGVDPLNPQTEVVEALQQTGPLGDNIRVFPYMLVLSKREYEEVIRKGAEQRGRALARFFEDIILGKGRALSPKGFISEKSLNRIFHDEGWTIESVRDLWKGASSRQISFVYGPDLVRRPDGKWVVLEDNVGPIGGVGDIDQVQKAHWQAFSNSGARHIPAATEEFISAISFLARAHGVSPNQILAITDISKDQDAAVKESPSYRKTIDMEDYRRRKFFEDLGLKMAEKIDGEALRLVENFALSFVLNFHTLGDAHDVYELYSRHFAKQGKFLLNAPATEILSNKALLPYVDQMIRFYLSEEPLLPSQETEVIDSRWAVSLPGKVIKKANGSQGKDVIILDNQIGGDFDRIDRFVLNQRAFDRMHPSRSSIWVVQPFVPMSTMATPMGRYTVDLRPHTYVANPDMIHVSSIPWGRTSPLKGSGLNNVSQGAYELAVTLFDCAAGMDALTLLPGGKK
ncbi:MAG: circularly permuted type 2 ATP-grasp protein [Oligoflexia bacterium]|nr:circularly permuted type 2 ATP-grasp protein [Oligoflexia bacterium]